MLRWSRARVAIWPVIGAAACSGFGASTTADAPPAVDPDASAPADANADVFVPVDGGVTDAEADADASSCSGWCACRPQPTDFCDDFDTPAFEAGAGWSQLVVDPDAGAGGFLTDFVSAPRSMELTTPLDTQLRQAVLIREDIGNLEPGKTVRVSFDAKMDFSSGKCANEDLYVATIGMRQLSVATEEVHLRLNTTDISDMASFGVQQSSKFPTQYSLTPLGSDPIHGKWARLTLVAKLAPNDAGAQDLVGQLFVGAPGSEDGGVLAAEGSVAHEATMKFVDVTLGLRRTYQSVACRILLDNVRMAVE